MSQDAVPPSAPQPGAYLPDPPASAGSPATAGPGLAYPGLTQPVPAPVATQAGPTADTAAASSSGGLVSVLLIGAAVPVVLGVYGRLHGPTGVAVNLAGFSGPLEVKVWLTTLAFTLALVQLVSALAMYGKLPISAPRWTGTLHRWSGRIAFLAAVPVAVHCLYAVGFQSYDLRVLVHSITGCLFFGAFTVKMLSLSRSGLPGWLLPVFGASVFTGLTMLWLTASLWFFTTTGVRF